MDLTDYPGPTDYFAHHVIDDPLIPVAVRASVCDSGIRAHRHDFVEVVLITHGRGIHTWHLDDEVVQYAVNSGDLFAISPGQEHGYSQCKGLRLLNLIFAPDLLSTACEHLGQLDGLQAFFLVEPLFRRESAFSHKLHLDPGGCQAFAQLITDLDQILRDRSTGYASLAKARFLEAMVRIAQTYEASDTCYGSTAQTAQRAAVAQAIAFMESHFDQRLSVADIAREVYLSPTYFAECFKRETGSPPGDYLIGVRLEAAALALRSSDDSITSIALDAGFCDSGHFARVFKQRYGQTPRAYRNTSLR